MRSAVLFFIFLFIVIVASIVGAYFFMEKPAQEQKTEFINISISARDPSNNLIKTGYEILLNGNFFKVGETKKGIYVLENIPTNKTLSIYNKNLEGQEYYTIEPKIFLTSGQTSMKRFDLRLEEYPKLKISHAGSLGASDQIALIVSPTEEGRDFISCLSWGPHIISVDMINRTRYPNEEKKCFAIRNMGKDEIIRLKITSLGAFSDLDYLDINFLNVDKRPIEGEVLIDTGRIYEINYI